MLSRLEGLLVRSTGGRLTHQPLDRPSVRGVADGRRFPTCGTMMRRTAGVLILAATLTAGATPWAVRSAQAATSAWVGDAHAAVRLMSADETVGTAPSVEAGLEFRFAPGWHGYWRTPGDAGLPPMIDWTGSTNLDGAAIAWPAPRRLIVQGLQNAVYEGNVVLPVTIALARPGMPASLRATVGFEACSNVCVPFEADLTLALPAGSALPSPEASLIMAARARVPGSAEAAGLVVEAVTVTRDGSRRTLTVGLKTAGAPLLHPDLFVEGAGDGLPGPPKVDLRDGGLAARLTVDLPASTQPDPTLMLTVTDGDRNAVFATGTPQTAVASSWVVALASALLGGLVLNLMPCVLPVLSIKLLGLVRQAGADRRASRFAFAATGLGVIASFLVLALVLVGLQWSGASLGWGIRFQQPWFLAGMASLTVLFAASLFDWIAIGLPSSIMTLMGGGRARGPLVEAFLTGAFATLLATPCSAPFVGTAVGFALAQGAGQIIAIFLCLGVGMALPYGVAAAFPQLARYLPRPGRWMLVLRAILGVLLLGTAGWLLLVLASVAGAWAAGLTLGLLVCLLAVVAVDRDRPHARTISRTAATVILALAPLAVAALPAPASDRGLTEANWKAFDPGAIPGLVAQGKTVLVDVTATWCLTCKINDLAALDRTDVGLRLDRADVVRMRADWSRPNAAIATYLQGFGRYGIPLDVVYGPRRESGEALPELLTPGLVLQALDRAAPETLAVSAAPQ